MFIIDDILLSPLKGLMWLGDKISELAEGEKSDESQLKEKLMALRLRFELDEINEEEYNQGEKESLAQLEELSKNKEEKEKNG